MLMMLMLEQSYRTQKQIWVFRAEKHKTKKDAFHIAGLTLSPDLTQAAAVSADVAAAEVSVMT